jgi:DNA-binding NtrC family response regulator
MAETLVFPAKGTGCGWPEPQTLEILGTMTMPDLEPSNLEPAEAASATQAVILLVDNNAQVLQETAALLRDCGYAVLVAQSALEAAIVAAQRSGRIDLVLTDFDLGSNLGTDLAALLQIVQPSVRVLITSSSCQPDVGDTPLTSDRQFHFLRKPFTRDQLIGRIGNLIANAT